MFINHHFSKKMAPGGGSAAPLCAQKKIDARGHRQLAEACYSQRTLEASSALAAASWPDEIAWFVGIVS